MKKFGKKAAALACALLMLAGSAAQASAGSTKFVFREVQVTGTASKVSTTTARATTSYTGRPANAIAVTPHVRAYVTVNGARQYGAKASKTSYSSSDSVSGEKYVVGGFGTSGYGGEHSVTVMLPNASGGFTNYSSGNQYSNY